jgi:hypothetical protein
MILDTKKGKKTLFLSSNLTYLLTQHALDQQLWVSKKGLIESVFQNL